MGHNANFNQFLDCETAEPFWGTRKSTLWVSELCLAVTDHASQSIFGKRRQRPFCLPRTSPANLLPTHSSIFVGVTLYVVATLPLPAHEGLPLEKEQEW